MLHERFAYIERKLDEKMSAVSRLVRNGSLYEFTAIYQG